MNDDDFLDTPETEPAYPRPRYSGAAQPATRGRPTDSDGSLRRTYRNLRRQHMRLWQTEGAECYFGCPGALDFSLPHGDQRAVTVHHTVPVALRPDLEGMTSLWRPSHALCNKLGQAAFMEGEPITELEPEPDTGWPSEPELWA
jgi:hypothetical protein